MSLGRWTWRAASGADQARSAAPGAVRTARCAIGILMMLQLVPGGAAQGAEIPWFGIVNGGFEQGLHPRGHRPMHWNIGFPGDDEVSPDSWRLIIDEGLDSQVLEISCRSLETACVVSQVADLPARAMTGHRLRLTGRLRTEGSVAVAGIQLVALNPEVAPDPTTGVPHVGYLDLQAAGSEWSSLAGEVEVTGVAELIAVAVYVVGDGALLWVDDLRLEADLQRPSCGSSERPVPSLVGGLPPFSLGVVNENPRSESDRGRSALVARAAEFADLVNVFAHIRWNGLRGVPLLDGHEPALDVAARARELGLDRMLTLDFTHAALEGLGDINPMPDGSPVDRLDGPTRAAYLDELEALVMATGSKIVSVGIETNFFWQRHPEQWPDFRSLVCSAADRLHALDPPPHVTTYFTLDDLVANDLTPQVQGQAALAALLPCIESVGFSFYPADGVHPVADLPDGLMTAASAVAPGLPLIVPEFGMRSDGIYSEEDQESFLRWALNDLAAQPTVAAVLYSLHDQTYLGTTPFFQDAFRHIGLFNHDGSPKRSWRMLRQTRARSAGSSPPVLPRPWCAQEPRRPKGRAFVGP